MKYLHILIFLLITSSSIAQIQIGQDLLGTESSERLGRSIAISGDGTRIIMGSSGDDTNGNTAGKAQILENVNGTWVPVGQTLYGPGPANSFGYQTSMSADGKRVAISSVFYPSYNSQDEVQIFEEINGSWVQIGQDILGETINDESGFALSISADGKRIAIGGHHNAAMGQYAGHTRIFEEQNGTWSQVGLDIDGEAEYDNSGKSVSISADGKRVAIGAPGHSTTGQSAGRARVFEEINGNWIQIGQNLDGKEQGDNLGEKVALSADGTTIAVSAVMNDDAAYRAGQVTIFKEINGTWVQIGQDINGDKGSDKIGSSLSISGDGKRVVIGDLTPQQGFPTRLRGKVRVFDEQNGSWIQRGQNLVGQKNDDFLGYNTCISSDGNVLMIGTIKYDTSPLYDNGLIQMFTVGANYFVEINALLEGPYDAGTGLMKDQLRAGDLIPNAEPYADMGYLHNGGGYEYVLDTVLTTTGPDAIVDWVFVELRSELDSSLVLVTHSALLQADGDIVAKDGISTLSFSGPNVTPGNYWVVVRHRNHLDAMSSTTIYLDSLTTATCNLTKFGGFDNGTKQLGKWLNVLYAGDANQDHVISSPDRSLMWNNRNQFGYLTIDASLNGSCDAIDRSQAWNNRNAQSTVP